MKIAEDWTQCVEDVKGMPFEFTSEQLVGL